jgi:hypothetical protein
MRRSAPVLLILLAGLAACEPSRPVASAPADAVGGAPPPPAASEPSAQVETLAGAWRVAGIDGSSLDEPVGLSLTGDAQQLWWEPRCAGVARAYRIEGQRIRFASNQTPGPVCDIGQPPRLEEVTRALDNAASVARTPNNGILISGPAHSILLFSQ